MSIFLALFFIPILLALAVRFFFKSTITWKEMGLQMAAVSIVISLMYGMAAWYSTTETQIINGQVTDKVRLEDSHMESYTCNCRTVCSGSGQNQSCSTQCDTCWRRRYTVDWYLESTIDRIRLDYTSSLSSSVWKTPDPQIYVDARVGEHCSKYVRQTNYIKAAPRSLFNLSDQQQFSHFAKLMPPYPEIYGIYKSDHVLNIDAEVDIEKWNDYFKDRIKTLGATVNPLIILTKQPQMIKEALEHSWLGGAAKDVAILIGVSDNKVVWTDGFTVGKSEGNYLLLAKLRDGLLGRDAQDFKAIIDFVDASIRADFRLKDMEDFAYLKKDIRPSNTVTTIIFILMLVGSATLTYVFHVNDVFGDERRWRYR